MNQEGKLQNGNNEKVDTIQDKSKEKSENFENKNEEKQDQHTIEEKLEELLKMGWIMLPESCNNPCKKISNYFSKNF
jgi:hypothetical protein